ncbi:hypothetical protein DIS09_31925 [Burkholderia pseudomallei]|nr:hypothetical protein BOC35_07925 [Burkholderia pseudomallei]KGW37012.1 hypothetical protein Y045_5996 [Burkholderia pseudomallei MSHR2451]PNW91393.1 hypothetical protein CF649_37620 [Burkholderia sp. 136(2017)]ARK56239.1 hypothetical protein BOC36_24525 [Burkholderia pseudomallei]ARK58801.1 hypothetical protein BOC37_01385 [Burkholderia pseudomallei]
MTVLIQPPVQTTLIVRRWRMTLDSRHFQLTKRQSPVNTGLSFACAPGARRDVAAPSYSE